MLQRFSSFTVIVDSTVTARIKRSEIISNSNIQDGDVIIGLSSFGKANYESEYNGGMGSNGLTSARHDVFANYLSTKYPESFGSQFLKNWFTPVPTNLIKKLKRLVLPQAKWCSHLHAPMLQ